MASNTNRFVKMQAQLSWGGVPRRDKNDANFCVISCCAFLIGLARDVLLSGANNKQHPV
jgi:hypothetical protein